MIFDAAFWSQLGRPVLTSLIASSLIAGVVQIVLKGRYDDRLARRLAEINAQNGRDLEQYKSELAAGNALSLEQSRGKAALDAERFKQRFALLAARQAEAVIDLAEKLAEMDLAARRLTSPGWVGEQPSPNTLLRECDEKRWAAMEFLSARRLLFPKEIGTAANDIIDRVNKAQSVIAIAPFSDRRSVEERKLASDADREMNGPGALALADLIDKLRDLLQGH